MTQPAAYDQMSLDALAGIIDIATRQQETAAELIGAVRAELDRRYGGAVREAIAAKGGFGTVKVPLPDGFELHGETRKMVSYDTEKLLALGRSLTWDEFRQLFKIELSVSEKVFAGVAAVSPILAEQITDARTVTPRPAPLKLVRK